MCASEETCSRYGQAGANAEYVIVPGEGYLSVDATEFKMQRPCPWGTYDNRHGETSPVTSYSVTQADNQCIYCPPGFACMLGTGDPDKSGVTKPLKCERGHWCDKETRTVTPTVAIGSPTPAVPPPYDVHRTTVHTRHKPCPAGTWYADQDAAASGTCNGCSAGNYCPQGAYKESLCPSGYFCPANTGNYETSPCPAGTYGINQGLSDDNSGGTTGCEACPLGHYCPLASIMPIAYQRGTHRSTTSSQCAHNGLSQPGTNC